MPNRSEVSLERASPSNKFNLSTAELKEMAKKLRRHVITMTATAGSGHPGLYQQPILLQHFISKSCAMTLKIPSGQTVTDLY
jgi:hypothetical protein